MEHIYLIDTDNRLCQHMANLRPQIADLINKNVSAMADGGRGIRVRSAHSAPCDEFVRQIGCTPDSGLWDKLITEYNAKHPDTPLMRWI